MIFAPVALAARLVDDLTVRLACHLAGHQPSWVTGAALGYTRPACARCLREL